MVWWKAAIKFFDLVFSNYWYSGNRYIKRTGYKDKSNAKPEVIENALISSFRTASLYF